MYPELVISVLGLISGFLITRKHQMLRKVVRSAAKKENKDGITPDITDDAMPDLVLSAIIPNSNDHGDLAALLENLAGQSRMADEIVIVSDRATELAADHKIAGSIRLVQTSPELRTRLGENEKINPYIAGADAAAGDLLLFLPTDVRLERDAIQLMLQVFKTHPSGVPTKRIPVITIQLYCQTRRLYDNASLFPSLIGSISDFISSKWSNHLIDSFGPVSLMTRDVFQSIRSQFILMKEAVGSVALDLETGQSKGEEDIAYRHIVGGQDIQSRTDGGGFLQTLQKWVADTAPQILRIRPGLLIMIALWLIACTTIVIELVQASMQTDAWPVLIYLALYLLTLLQLNLASRHIGRYSRSAIFFYPFWLASFWVIFLVSLLRAYVFRKKQKSM